MNPQPRTVPRLPLVLLPLALLCSAAIPLWAAADEPSANPTTMGFAAGGTIRMKLNVGAMKVVGVSRDKITVSWHAKSPDDERDVSVKLTRSGANDASLVVDGPGNRIQYRIEVPQQSDVTIRMRAGELQIQGISGSVDAELLAGEMDLRVADPRNYRRVSASVGAGELNARPWQTDTGGVWRTFKASGDGEHDLRAWLLAGQLTIRSE